MDLNALTKHIRQSKSSNGSKTEVGWVTWDNEQEKIPFSKGITIIENKALLTHRYRAYIVCVSEPEDLTDAEDNASDEEIAMTPNIASRNPNTYDRTSVPESPEMLDEDSDSDSIIHNSQEEFSMRNKCTGSPETLSAIGTTSLVELRFEDSTASIHDEVETKNVSKDTLKLANDIDIHDALTQLSSEVDEMESINNGDNKNERDTETIIIKKELEIPCSLYDQETELSVYEQETEMCVNEQETKTINDKTDLIKCMIEKDSCRVRSEEYNIHKEETQKSDMNVDDNLSQRTDKINSNKGDIGKDISRIDHQQSQKLTVNVDAKGDAFNLNSVNCDFEINDETDAPDSPDSMSLLVDIPPDKDEDDNFDINPDDDDDDPYNQDTQIMDLPTRTETSQLPSHEIKCVNEEDELTQVMEEEIILCTQRNALIAKAQITNENNVKKNYTKDSSKADGAIKKFKIPDESSVDVNEEDVFIFPNQITKRKTHVLPSKCTDISGARNTCTDNLLDAPTQKLDEAPNQKFINISRVSTLNIESTQEDILDAPTQQIIDTLDAPTQQIIDALDAPTPTLPISYPQKAKNIKIVSDDDIADLNLSEADKGEFKTTSPVSYLNTRRCKRLMSTDFAMGTKWALNSGQTSFAGTQEILDHLKVPAQSYITPMKRKILVDSNNSTDPFTFSTPAKIGKKKTKVMTSDTSFNESLITDIKNQLNISTSSPKCIVEENYYNNTRELEDDLLSQTIVGVVEKSPMRQIHKKANKSLQEVILNDLPSTNKNILIRSEDRESENNYYGCTQEVMEDLLTPQNPTISPIISPVKMRSSKRKLPPCDQATFDNKTNKKNIKLNFHYENDFYQSTQDVMADLLTQTNNKSSSLEIQNTNYENCPNDQLFNKMPSPIKKNSSQLSDSCSETFENLTPLKSGFKYTISDSELDSPQIKNFVLRTQSSTDQLSNSDTEDDPKKDTEDDVPIVFRKTVPKRKQRIKSTVEEVKQTRSSSRVKNNVDKIIHSSETSDKDCDNSKSSSKTKPVKPVRRLSVVIERCNDLNLDNLNKVNKGGQNKGTNDLGTTGKAFTECSSLKSKNDVSSSNIEKNCKRGKNVTKEIGNQIMVSDECQSRAEANESESGILRKLSSKGKNKEKVNIINVKDASVNKNGNRKKYFNIKPIENLSIVLEPLTIEMQKKSKTLLQEAGSSIADTNKSEKGIISNSNPLQISQILGSNIDSKRKKATLRDRSIIDRVQCEGGESMPEKISVSERTSRKEGRNSSKKDSSKVKEKSKSINVEQKRLSDRTRKLCIEVAKQDNSTAVRRSRSSSCSSKITPLKVMFTRLEDVKAVNCVVKLGGTVVEQDGDVLVSGCSKRTVKLMMAIARGKPVVSPSWLTESAGSKRFLDPWKYLLKDEVMENRFNFCLKTSLETAKPYLKGWMVYLTPKILPMPQEMKDLIEASGGQAELVKAVGRRSTNLTSRGSAGTFSVTCTEDSHLWPRLPRPLVKPEAIMMGAIKHTLLYNSYKLEESS